MFQLNQASALILGKLSGSWVLSMSVIQADFDPPHSVDRIADQDGLLGASVSN